MSKFSFLRCFFALVFVSVCVLSGCTSLQPVPEAAVAHAKGVKGRFMGGEQPITAATIQLWTVNTSTTGGASTSLTAGATITTSDGTGVMNSNANAGNANNTLPAGYFYITSFSCTSNQLLYLTASQGNSGGTGNNPQIQQMLALGTCSYVESSVPNVVINEVTTVGTVAALHNYMTAYNAVGSSSGAALTAAFTTAAEYINLFNGGAPGPTLPSGYYASSNELLTLADVVYACVNSLGGSYNDGTACGKLFLYAKPSGGVAATDTVGALMQIFAAPTNQVTNIFYLVPSTPPFAALSQAPIDWSLPILQIPTTPVISPNGGSFTTVKSVTITDADTDGTNAIYYTVDGTTPSVSSTLYTGPISVSVSQTVTAIDIDDSRLSSSVSSASFTISGLSAPTVGLSSVSATYGTTTGQTITATSNNNGYLVTFGTAGAVGGSFAPTTCTITSGSCAVTYTPSGTLGVGTYAGDLTASFAAGGFYAAGSATSTLTISTAYSVNLLYSFLAGNPTGYTGDGPEFGGLIQAVDGNFYGMTETSGLSSAGAIFKMTPAGAGTLVHAFTGQPDGKNAYGGLVQGTDGNFYGMTEIGGSHNMGSVFNVTPAGAVTVLHPFAGTTADAKDPFGNVVQGSDGNFYGMTRLGGANAEGIVFEITSGGSFNVLHSFTSASSDGNSPVGSLLQGSDGNFYGMTFGGGTYGNGTVFQVTTGGAVNLIYSFAGTADGKNPNGSLVQGSDGNFYGLTEAGGANGYGSIFKISYAGSFTLLYSFPGTPGGQNPYGSLVLGSDGNFYGLTELGGTDSYGSVFKITPGGSFSLLYSFGGTPDGQNPYDGLVQGSDGNFYGMTRQGGANSVGSVFAVDVSPALAAPITLSVPSSVVAGASFTFSYAVSNAANTAGVTATSNTTMQGCEYFATNSSGTQVATGELTGSVSVQNATLTAPSSAGTYTYALTCGGVETSSVSLTVVLPTAVAPTFSPVGGSYMSVQNVTLATTSTGASIYYTTDGTMPTTSSTVYSGAISVASSETINAIASGGGYLTSTVGSAVYAITLTAPTVGLSAVTAPYLSTTGVTFTATSNANGAVVTFGMAGAVGGSFSPTSCTIASGSCAVSYMPSGSLGVGTYTNDLTAGFTASGSYLAASASSTLTIDPFRLLTSFTGTSGVSPGERPFYGNLIQANDGNFYGMTDLGGASNLGTIFKVTSAGTYTLLHSFAGGTADGKYPYGNLVQGKDGNFYGTTSAGGANTYYGTIFQMTPGGIVTLLHSFDFTDGEFPRAGLVQGSDGNFYGVTDGGGANYGVFFSITSGGSFTALHSFANATDGNAPEFSLVQGSDGNFYGVTVSGGANTYGTIFKITTAGSLTVLHSFSGPDSYGASGSLVQGSDGNFYGTGSSGGAHNDGLIFEITPGGVFTTVYPFTGTTTDGGAPNGNLVQGSDGNLYGVTGYGGTTNVGTVFKATNAGAITLLHSFTAATDGDDPQAGLVQGSDGDFYGVTNVGGASSDGTIFSQTAFPTLAAPITLTVPSSVTHSTSFTFSYKVSNAQNTAGVTVTTNTTMQNCQYFATNSTGTQVATGALTGKTTVQNATLTAPSTAGTYTYALTCGGVESSTISLSVQ